jgi:hypothetical protein
MMDKKREARFRQLLLESKIDPTTFDYYIKDEDTNTPMFPMVVFMKHVWDKVIRKNAGSWIKPTIEDLEGRMGRKDLYALRFLPERPELLDTLKRIQQSNVDEGDLTMVVREAQLALLEHIISMIDGGMAFEEGEDGWGLYEVKFLSDEIEGGSMTLEKAEKYSELYGDEMVPTRSFFDMKEYVWYFDPDKE